MQSPTCGKFIFNRSRAGAKRTSSSFFFLFLVGLGLSNSGCGKLWGSVTTFTQPSVTQPQVYSAAWVGGSNTITHNGGYGVQNTGSTLNIPGTRNAGAGWTDTSGNFWIFGGYGSDSAGTQDRLNDLWEYQPSSGQWTWVTGSKFVDQSGTYGARGVGSTLYTPGARFTAVNWTDSSGNFWLFSGTGYDSAGNNGVLNDLWKYTPANGQWAFEGGVISMTTRVPMAR